MMFPKGKIVRNWTTAKNPIFENHHGQCVYLEPLQAKHIEPLYMALIESPDYDWHYMPFGPFDSLEIFKQRFYSYIAQIDPMFFAIRKENSEEIFGFLSYLNIKPECGSIEIGYIQFSTSLQRTVGATEAVFLLIKHAFELGYRRVEWKCDSLNSRSKKAAERLGFQFEGIFRQATVVKGRNRDTAWYSIIDKEWEELNNVFDYWFANLSCSDSYISLSRLVRKIKVN